MISRQAVSSDTSEQCKEPQAAHSVPECKNAGRVRCVCATMCCNPGWAGGTTAVVLALNSKGTAGVRVSVASPRWVPEGLEELLQEVAEQDEVLLGAERPGSESRLGVGVG